MRSNVGVESILAPKSEPEGDAFIAERIGGPGGSAIWGSAVWGGFVWAGASPIMSYFTVDHLASITVIANAGASVTERDSYDAWGRRRNPNGTDNTACAVTSTTTRGFTGQEMMDSVCTVNLNARIYDPTIARVMAADPDTAKPYDLQGLNRYTYVDNRPLDLTDPTGDEPIVSDFANEEGCEPCSVYDYGAGASTDPQGQSGRKQNSNSGSSGQQQSSDRPSGNIQLAEGDEEEPEGLFVSGKSGKSRTYSETEVAREIGILRDAAKGKGQFTIPGSVTAEQADDLGRAWVGPGAKIASDGKTLYSAFRQYRPPSAKPNDPYTTTGVRANFESRSVPGGQWQNNGHLDIKQ
jgi:RHS repeat-associated protein